MKFYICMHLCNHYPDQDIQHFQYLRRPLQTLSWSVYLPHKVTNSSACFAPHVGALEWYVFFVSGFFMQNYVCAIHPLHVSFICSFSLLSSISFLMSHDFFLSIPLLMDIWVISSLRLLWMKCLWMFLYMSFVDVSIHFCWVSTQEWYRVYFCLVLM